MTNVNPIAAGNRRIKELEDELRVSHAAYERVIRERNEALSLADSLAEAAHVACQWIADDAGTDAIDLLEEALDAYHSDPTPTREGSPPQRGD